MGFSKINYADLQYPAVLKETRRAPRQLFVSGELRLDRPLVAVVGSRKPTAYGLQMAEQIGRDLASAGVGVVSGLAYGIDRAVHRAVLDANGYTIAVLGNGAGRVHPGSNRVLAKRIIEQGSAVVTEYSDDTATQPFMFIERNRIIAGLCLAVVVVEAGAKSGALTTAQAALQANRTVMAVPGPTTSELSAGTNGLIRSGAVLVRQAIDILDELNLPIPESHHGSNATSVNLPTKGPEATICQLIARGVHDSQQLIDKAGLSAAEFARLATLLELSGVIRDSGNGSWILVGRSQAAD